MWGVSSCATSKKLGVLPERNKEEVVQALRKRNIDFQWFSGKSRCYVESNSFSGSGTMNIRMRYDSILWITFKKFGIEAGRLLVDKKSYTALNRIEGVYEKGSIHDFNELVAQKIDLPMIQKLIFANAILPDHDMFNFYKDSIYYVVHSKHDQIDLEYYVNGYNMLLEKMTIAGPDQNKLIAYFDDYRTVEGFGTLPYERKYVFPDPTDGFNLELEFTEMDINVPKEVKFTIPSDYERLD